jgi:hypothetical protein
MSKYEVVDSDPTQVPKHKAPVTIMLESIDGDFMIAREVAEHFGVHVETIRRASRARNKDGTKRIKAPSKMTRTGDMFVYLYTPEDVEEIGQYLRKSRVEKGQ